MNKFLQVIGTIVLIIMAVFGLSLIAAIPVYLLWNWLMPTALSGLPVAKSITLFEAWGISFLCGILFKGFSTSSK